MRLAKMIKQVRRKSSNFKKSVRRANYLAFINKNKQEVIFDKSKVTYRDGDNT